MTGGCGELGLEAARGLLEHGCPGIALLDLNPTASTARTDQLTAEFPSSRILVKQVDITDFGGVESCFGEVFDELESVETLLCFAGVSSSEASLDVPIEQFRRVLDINTTGSFLCAQVVAR